MSGANEHEARESSGEDLKAGASLGERGGVGGFGQQTKTCDQFLPCPARSAEALARRVAHRVCRGIAIGVPRTEIGHAESFSQLPRKGRVMGLQITASGVIFFKGSA